MLFRSAGHRAVWFSQVCVFVNGGCPPHTHAHAQPTKHQTNTHTLFSHDAVGEILETVIELGGDGAHGAVHHLLHQHLQLLLRQAHVETFLQGPDGAGAMEARQLGTWDREGQKYEERKGWRFGEREKVEMSWGGRW